MLSHIKDRINHGEPLESIQLTDSNEKQMSTSPQDPLHPTDAEPMQDILSRIHYIERTLDQKADEVVMIQLLQQREELEDLRIMIKQLAATLEPMQVSKATPSHLMKLPIPLLLQGCPLHQENVVYYAHSFSCKPETQKEPTSN